MEKTYVRNHRNISIDQPKITIPQNCYVDVAKFHEILKSHKLYEKFQELITYIKNIKIKCFVVPINITNIPDQKLYNIIQLMVEKITNNIPEFIVFICFMKEKYNNLEFDEMMPFAEAHHNINKSKKIFNALEKIFTNNFIWNGSDNKNIVLTEKKCGKNQYIKTEKLYKINILIQGDFNIDLIKHIIKFEFYFIKCKKHETNLIVYDLDKETAKHLNNAIIKKLDADGFKYTNEVN